MPEYRYQMKTPGGETTTGTVSADSALTASQQLRAQGNTVLSLTPVSAKKKGGFTFQRSLMPGGACEGTCFDAFGYTAAAVCVALGNYHNMDRDKKTMGPEFISVRDWQHMVRLFVETARGLHDFTGDHSVLRDKLTDNLDKAMPLVKNPLLPVPTR